MQSAAVRAAVSGEAAVSAVANVSAAYMVVVCQLSSFKESVSLVAVWAAVRVRHSSVTAKIENNLFLWCIRCLDFFLFSGAKVWLDSEETLKSGGCKG